MRLSDAEFMQLTHRQFCAKLDRVRDWHDRADLRAGTISAVMANCWRDANTSPFTPHDFFPGLPKPIEHETPPDTLIAMMEHFAARCNKNN